MFDVRAHFQSTHPTFVAEFDAALVRASPFKPVALAPRLAVNGLGVPFGLKFDGIGDPEEAALRSPWHRFFAEMFVTLDTRSGAGLWGDRGVANRILDDRAPSPEAVSGYVDETRLRFTWGQPRVLTSRGQALLEHATLAAGDVYGLVDEPGLRQALADLAGVGRLDIRCVEPGFDAVAVFTERTWPDLRVLSWPSALGSDAAERLRAAAPRLEVLHDLGAQHALAAARRAIRATGRATAAARTDIGGVEVATMGRELSLRGTTAVLADLSRLPKIVRVLRVSPGDLGGNAAARALAALDLELLDVSGNRFDASAAELLPASTVLGVQAPAARIDLEDRDFRRADPDRAYDTWRRWIARIHAAVQRILDAQGRPEAEAWLEIARSIGPDEPVGAPWDEHEARIRAWVKAAKKVATPRAKAGDDLQPLYEALAGLTRAVRRDEDIPYKGVAETARIVPMVVGSARVTNAARFGWVQDAAALEAVEREIRET